MNSSQGHPEHFKQHHEQHHECVFNEHKHCLAPTNNEDETCFNKQHLNDGACKNHNEALHQCAVYHAHHS